MFVAFARVLVNCRLFGVARSRNVARNISSFDQRWKFSQPLARLSNRISKFRNLDDSWCWHHELSPGSEQISCEADWSRSTWPPRAYQPIAGCLWQPTKQALNREGGAFEWARPSRLSRDATRQTDLWCWSGGWPKFATSGIKQQLAVKCSRVQFCLVQI